MEKNNGQGRFSTGCARNLAVYIQQVVTEGGQGRLNRAPAEGAQTERGTDVVPA